MSRSGASGGKFDRYEVLAVPLVHLIISVRSWHALLVDLIGKPLGHVFDGLARCDDFNGVSVVDDVVVQTRDSVFAINDLAVVDIIVVEDADLVIDRELRVLLLQARTSIDLFKVLHLTVGVQAQSRLMNVLLLPGPTHSSVLLGLLE